MGSLITGTGSYIPDIVRSNEDFAHAKFYTNERQRITSDTMDIIGKFEKITGIVERRYAQECLNASDLAAYAGAAAIKDAGVDAETLDQLIVAHNFGDVPYQSRQGDAVPSLASRVKRLLSIENPNCVAYDLLFGCPGWLQGLIQADVYIRAGMARKCLVIGAETLSRVIDPHDRDSMIYSDGAGAVVLEAGDGHSRGGGFLGSVSQTHALDECNYITLGHSYCPPGNEGDRYLKMQGRKVYEFAVSTVPAAMKACLEVCSVELDQLKKIFIHQANEKMDAAIVRSFYALFGRRAMPDCIMPMNIRELGNSSVATIPTLYDMVRKAVLPDHRLHSGDIVLFASVGAGMNVNAVCYQV